MARPAFQAVCSRALQESVDCRARHASLRARPTQKWQVAGPGGRPGRRADKVDDARAQAELAQQRGGLGGADPGVRALHGAAQLVAAVGVHAAAPRALQPRLQPGYVRHEARAAKQLLAHALPRRAPRLVPGRAARTLGCPEGTRHTCPRLAGGREMQSFGSRRRRRPESAGRCCPGRVLRRGCGAASAPLHRGLARRAAPRKAGAPVEPEHVMQGAPHLAPHEVGGDHHDVAPAAAPAHVRRAGLEVVHMACRAPRPPRRGGWRGCMLAAPQSRCKLFTSSSRARTRRGSRESAIPRAWWFPVTPQRAARTAPRQSVRAVL